MSVASLILEKTKNTLSVIADSDKGLLCMSGESYPENSFEFFAPLIKWVENYLHSQSRLLRIELNIAYMNTSSVKAMMDIFDLLEEAHQQNRQIEVVWFYDPRNERVVEMIEEFKEDCSFPFSIEKLS